MSVHADQDAQVTVAQAGDLSLCLLDDRQSIQTSRLIWVAAASLFVNALLLIGISALASIQTPPIPPARQIVDARRAVKLYLPTELTQKEPNKADVTKEIRLENLLPKPEVKEAKRVFTPPPAPKPVPLPPANPQLSMEPPVIQTAQAPPTLGAVPNVLAPPVQPPKTQSPEKPKLAFETPGLPSAPTGVRPGGLGKIAPPKSGVDEAMHAIQRGGSAGGLVVGDTTDEIGIGSASGRMPSPGRPAANVELQSDSHGIDFKPYLIRILASVRRNWSAVYPESARLGQRGKVLIQFIISKDGSVPKLVIVTPSGTVALDRAAVAGIQASTPFPPLPGDFRGDEIRLQLAFSYNIPTR